MLPAGCPGPRELPRLNSLDNLLHLIVREQDLCFALDVSRIAPIKNVLGHRGLELALAPKHDDRVQL